MPRGGGGCSDGETGVVAGRRAPQGRVGNWGPSRTLSGRCYNSVDSCLQHASLAGEAILSMYYAYTASSRAASDEVAMKLERQLGRLAAGWCPQTVHTVHFGRQVRNAHKSVRALPNSPLERRTCPGAIATIALGVFHADFGATSATSEHRCSIWNLTSLISQSRSEAVTHC